MENINVEGVPEPVARAVQAMVQALREQLAKDHKKESGELPVWPGTVIGSLTREEIWVCAILDEGGLWNHLRGITRKATQVPM